MDSALHPIVDVRPGGPDVDITAPPTVWCLGTDRVRFVPWIDPVVDRRSHDPRSTSVERTGRHVVFEPGEFVIGGES